MRSRTRLTIPTALLLAGILAVGLSTGNAESPTPTPTQTPRPEGGKSLNEVAKEKELKGAEKGKPIVITNENLSEYAGKGSLTTATGSNAEQPQRRPIRGTSSSAGVQAPDSGSGNTDERRRHWQGQYKSQVDLVASIRQQIRLLDEEIPGLWRDFYAWDDPMYRDGVIKPKLDDLMKRRDRLEQQLVEAESKLSQIKGDARQDGGEPGWFRGIPMPSPLPATPTPGVAIKDTSK